MKNSQIALQSLLRSLGVVLYVAGFAFLADSNIFKQNNAPEIFSIAFVLILFIVSASITGFLVLAKPIMLFMDGHKRQSVTFLFSVIGWLILFVLFAMLVIFR